jgi:hypothetical protein
MMPNILYSEIPEPYTKKNDKGDDIKYGDQTFIDFPWSRMIVQNEMAILSTKKRKKYML